jgi:hypothetical protein
MRAQLTQFDFALKFLLSLPPVQLIAKQNFDQNDPKRGSKERQRIDHLQNKPAKPAEIFYQVVRKVNPGLIQPVKNQVENTPATESYKSSKNIINNFHNMIDPTVWVYPGFSSVRNRLSCYIFLVEFQQLHSCDHYTYVPFDIKSLGETHAAGK